MNNSKNSGFTIREIPQKHFEILLFGGAVLLLISVIVLALIYGSGKKSSATLVGFRAGNIMSDAVMSNKNAMSEAQIQNFLKSKNPCNDTDFNKVGGTRNLAGGTGQIVRDSYSWNVKNGRFVCMADENFNGESAAHIIWQAAQDYSINPQVLIALLQKEQSLITDTYPNNIQYRSATGFGCPDTAACDSKYYGLKNQVRNAANLFRTVLNGGWSNYPAYQAVYVQYSPDASCGGAVINIENRATSALYRYTPYQPNAAALAAGTGTAHCGAYGNRNFYNYFTEWFGNTTIAILGAINQRYNQLGGETGSLGAVLAKEVCGGAGGGCWQAFRNGAVMWSPNSGAWESMHGAIRDKWQKLGFENGKMGYPTGKIYTGLKDNGSWQPYQNGVIIGSPKTGHYANLGALRARWAQLGYENGALGYPTGEEVGNLKNGGWYQCFENGCVIGSPTTGYWESSGSIRARWQSLGFENGIMGYPTGNIVCGLKNSGCYQPYQNGAIYWSSKTGAWENYGKVREKFGQLGWENAIGYPTSAMKASGSTQSQTFEKGVITYSLSIGARFTAK